MRLGILLAEGMRRLLDGTYTTWRVNQMDPNSRLRRYVARAQAWPNPDPDPALANLEHITFFDERQSSPG